MAHFNLHPRAATILFPALVVMGCGTAAPSPAPPQPLELGINALGIAVDATTVYVSSADPGPMMAFPVNGGPAVPVGVEASGKGLAVDERRLYWGDGGSLLSCDKSNCAATAVLLWRSGNQVSDIALDATNVYWTTTSTGVGGPLQVMKADKNSGTPIDGGVAIDGGTGGAGAVQIATASWPYAIAVDANYVYWGDDSLNNAGIMKAPIAGGAAVQLSANSIEPLGLALDDDNVYYGGGGGQVLQVSKNGGTTHTLLSGLGYGEGDLLVDGSTLYVDANNKVLSVPLAGGFISALATLGGSGLLAQDATSIYVAFDDEVEKVAKPRRP